MDKIGKKRLWNYSAKIVVLLTLLCATGTQAGPDEDKLLKILFAEGRYDPVSRPVQNDSDPVKVGFKMEMQQILDLDETKEILESTQWLHFEWNDYRLSWEPEEYGNVSVLIIPIDKLWKPDVLLYNSVHEDIDNRYQTNAYVNATGDVIWIPLGVYHSSCAINIEWFPFDIQVCKMKFGSWTYGQTFLDFTSLSDQIDTSTYQPNGEWDLIVADAKRNEQMYDCCPLPFVDITMIMVLKRRPGFYLLNVLIPCTFVSILTLFNFLQAPDSGEKVGLGITIMLSLSVFQLIIADMIPRTSTTVPVIGAYFCGVMCLCTISLIMTLLTLKCHHTRPEMHTLPNWIRVAICEWLSWFLRMQRPGKRITRKYLKEQWSSRRSRSKSFKASPEILQEAENSVVLVPMTTSTGSMSFVYKDEPNGYANTNTGHEENTVSSTVPIYAMAAQDLETLRYELRSILTEIKHMTKKLKDDEEAGNEVNEWQYAALVVDRLCFWFCSVIFILGTLTVFVYAPQQHDYVI